MEYALILLLCSWVLKWQRKRRQRQNRPIGRLWFSRREWRQDQWVVTTTANLKQIFHETVQFLDLWSKIWCWQNFAMMAQNVQISHTYPPQSQPLYTCILLHVSTCGSCVAHRFISRCCSPTYVPVPTLSVSWQCSSTSWPTVPLLPATSGWPIGATPTLRPTETGPYQPVAVFTR